MVLLKDGLLQDPRLSPEPRPDNSSEEENWKYFTIEADLLIVENIVERKAKKRFEEL